MTRIIALPLTLAALSGCGTPMHAEMLGESIKLFAGKMKTNNEKIWITGPGENACDSGCQLGGCVNKSDKGGVISGGLFGGSTSKDGSSPHDRLAWEVITNFFTQKQKFRVVESHRHNYAVELGVETRKKIDYLGEQGNKVSTTSCEDLCLLDEAKKRHADKVLVYHILEISNEEMKIHFRLSDVQSSIVEAAETIKVANMRAFDASPASFQTKSARAATPAAATND